MGPGSASLIVGGKIGYGKMALPVYRIVDIKVLHIENTAVTIDHHEVAPTTVPSDSRTDGSSGIDLTFHLLKAGLSHHADKIICAHEGLVEIPRHITRRRDRTITAIGMTKLSICHPALGPGAPPPIEMRYAR